MVDNLQPIGVRAVVENVAGYSSAMDQLASKTDSVNKKIGDATKSTAGIDKAFSSATDRIKGMIPQIGQTESALGDLGGAVGITGEAIAAIAIPIGIAAAAFAAFIALGQRGAGFSEIENGFGRITASVNVSADAMLTNLRSATEGTVSDFQLLTEVNNTLIGVTKDFGHQFGEALPDLMKIAKVTAEATGKDTIQVFDQITEAIRRGQTRMLMTSGIIIDQKAAFETYAKSIGVSVTAMTEAEREQALLNAVLEQGKGIVDALGQSQESNADKMQRASVTITDVLDKIAAVVQPIFGVVLDAINGILDTIGQAVSAIAPYLLALVQGFASVLQGFLVPIGNFLKSVLGIPKDISASAKNFFDGGARVIGALAGGIIAGANQYVFPAILAIAQGIADFLQGLSPPPKGPLHTIDQGGARLMEAWIGGITGVSLEPVALVAGQVAGIMGSVATASLGDVEAALARLDAQIKPFADQLTIVKSQFDAIDNIAKPALDAIDRQLNAAQAALATGSTAAAEQIRTLDAQKQAISAYVDQQQIAVDQAQIQLGLAQAQQAQERAILNIRLADLKAQQTTASKLPKTPTSQGAKGKAGGGGAPQEGTALGALGAGGAGGTPFSLTGDAAAAGADMAQNFAEGFTVAAGPAGLSTAQGFIAQIGTQVQRIGSTDIGAKIGNVFDTIVSNIKAKFAVLGDFFLDTFSPGKPGSIPDNIKNGIAAWGGIFENIGVIMQTSFIVPIQQKVALVKSFFDPSNADSIPARLTNFVTKVLPNAVVDLGTVLQSALSQKFTDTVNSIGAGLAHFFNDTSDDTLQGIIGKALNWIGTLPDQISNLFKSLASALATRFINPVIDSLNSVIDAFQSFVNDHILPIIRAIANVASGLAAATGQTDQANIWKAISQIQSIGFGHIPKAAAGGLFGAGITQVGERGTELVGASSQMAVFPHEFTAAIDRLSNILARPSVAMQSGASYSNTYNNRTMNNTFNGVSSPTETMHRLATMQAFGG